jgi:hypothetical protein
MERAYSDGRLTISPKQPTVAEDDDAGVRHGHLPRTWSDPRGAIRTAGVA